MLETLFNLKIETIGEALIYALVILVIFAIAKGLLTLLELLLIEINIRLEMRKARKKNDTKRYTYHTY